MSHAIRMRCPAALKAAIGDGLEFSDWRVLQDLIRRSGHETNRIAKRPATTDCAASFREYNGSRSPVPDDGPDPFYGQLLKRTRHPAGLIVCVCLAERRPNQ